MHSALPVSLQTPSLPVWILAFSSPLAPLHCGPLGLLTEVVPISQSTPSVLLGIASVSLQVSSPGPMTYDSGSRCSSAPQSCGTLPPVSPDLEPRHCTSSFCKEVPVKAGPQCSYEDSGARGRACSVQYLAYVKIQSIVVLNLLRMVRLSKPENLGFS